MVSMDVKSSENVTKIGNYGADSIQKIKSGRGGVIPVGASEENADNLGDLGSLIGAEPSSFLLEKP